MSTFLTAEWRKPITAQHEAADGFHSLDRESFEAHSLSEEGQKVKVSTERRDFAGRA